jgi:ketosteroid isomerase-like protein
MANCLKAKQASENSFAAVMAGDKEAWLALFAEDALVQDPVGESPLDPSGKGHQGKEAISAFWDNVIAHGSMTLTIKASFPAGDECANLAGLRNEIGDLVIENDMIVVYKANDEGKIVSLRAFWNYEELQNKLGG